MSSKVIIKALPIATRFKHRGAKKLLEADRARVRKLMDGVSPHGPKVLHDQGLRELVRAKKSFASDEATSIDVTDASVTYTMEVGVGSPATKYTLL